MRANEEAWKQSGGSFLVVKPCIGDMLTTMVVAEIDTGPSVQALVHPTPGINLPRYGSLFERGTHKAVDQHLERSCKLSAGLNGGVPGKSPPLLVRPL